MENILILSCIPFLIIINKNGDHSGLRFIRIEYFIFYF